MTARSIRTNASPPFFRLRNYDRAREFLRPSTMDTKRWRQIAVLYQSALDLDPDQRDAFLDQACADDDEQGSRSTREV
jgi:hypothetical protein